MKAIWILPLCIISGTLLAQQPKYSSLLSKDLAGISGKEGMVLTVEYPPGGADPIHRHNAYGFLYVIEGSVVMQVKGEKPVTLTAGQTWYEGPDDVHIVGRNASNTKPAKFVAFFVCRVDFLANKHLVVEIDGAAYHSSAEAVENDRIRDEYLIENGYVILRIPAKVVFNSPGDAVERVCRAYRTLRMSSVSVPRKRIV
jgi:quercetin dioxygenase-like cupin family protein